MLAKDVTALGQQSVSFLAYTHSRHTMLFSPRSDILIGLIMGQGEVTKHLPSISST
jgi:hypothetical protein